jgi:hypothetical protein
MNAILEPPPFKHTQQQLRAMDMLSSDASDCGLGGGSRSGKTFLLVYAVVTRALMYPNSRHAILRFRQNAIIKAVVRDTFPKMMDLCYPGVYDARNLNKTDWFYTLPNGSEIWFGGLDDKERVENILGNEYMTMYFNECSQIPWQSIKLALTRLAQKIPGGKLKAYYDFNPPSKRHWTYKLFIDKSSPDTNKPLISPMSIAFLYMNPLDNQDNLDPAYLQRLQEMPEKERKRFFLGQFSDEDNDALWNDETLEATRVIDDKELPDMAKVVIAVDPSGAENDDPDTRSDEIGIVAAGLGVDGRGYLLEDVSGKYGPSVWSKIVGDAFQRHLADAVVAESNFGGAMVKFTIEAGNTSGENINVKMVNASRGKVVRAAPIAALYDRGKISHVGYYPEIEEQLGSFHPDGYKGMRSPDRADAVIWAFTELFPGLVKDTKGPKDQPNPKAVANQNKASNYGHRGTPGLPNRGRP